MTNNHADKIILDEVEKRKRNITDYASIGNQIQTM